MKSRELAREFEALAFRSRPEYVTEDNVARLIGEGEVVFLMVDNHASRHLVSRHVVLFGRPQPHFRGQRL